MNEPDHSHSQPPRAQARLAIALPLLAWLSQIVIALYVRGAPAGIYLTAAGIQGLLIVGGMLLGVWALVFRRGGGVAVVVPAMIGLVLSAGTMLLIGLVAIAALLR